MGREERGWFEKLGERGPEVMRELFIVPGPHQGQYNATLARINLPLFRSPFFPPHILIYPNVSFPLFSLSIFVMNLSASDPRKFHFIPIEQNEISAREGKNLSRRRGLRRRELFLTITQFRCKPCDRKNMKKKKISPLSIYSAVSWKHANVEEQGAENEKSTWPTKKNHKKMKQSTILTNFSDCENILILIINAGNGKQLRRVVF